MDNWNRAATTKFISLFQQHPCLYKVTDKDYTNKYRRRDSYQQIIESMKDVKSDLTIVGIKKKIRTLQSQVSKERARIKASKEAGVLEKEYMPTLWCYQLLEFTFNTNGSTVTESSIVPMHKNKRKSIKAENEEGEEDIPTHEHIDEMTENKTALAENKSKKTTYQPIEEVEIASKPAKIIKKYRKHRAIDRGEHQFCQYLCTELKKVQNEDTFDDLKIDILRLVRRTIRDERHENDGREVLATPSMSSPSGHYISNDSVDDDLSRSSIISIDVLVDELNEDEIAPNEECDIK